MIKENYRKYIPEWCYDKTTEYGLMLTDDIDSLLGCSILKSVMGWKIDQTLLFKVGNQSFDYLGKTSNATKEIIGVDIALQNGKCFDNHLSRFSINESYNKECVNPNFWRGITRRNYHKKYCLSTALLLWGIYDLPLPQSEDGKMILLAIDGSYQGYYNKGGRFSHINREYLSILGLDGLIDCLDRHKDYEFKDIKKKYNLVTNRRDTKIGADNGFLNTDLLLDEISKEVGISCELPTERFAMYKTFHDKQMVLTDNDTSLSEITSNPFCVALTGKNYLCWSEEVNTKEIVVA